MTDNTHVTRRASLEVEHPDFEATSRLDDYVQHFQARALADALSAANRKQLLERAERFEAAKHRPGIDYPGQASVEQLRAQWLRCDEKARALRAAAYLGDPLATGMEQTTFRVGDAA